jgi:hypothetical protein
MWGASDSLYQRYRESTTLHINDTRNWQLSVLSMMLRVGDYPNQGCREFSRRKNNRSDSLYQRYTESATPCINDTQSQRLPVSTIHRVSDSMYQRCAELVPPGIVDSGESIFDYEHLRKCESKIKKGYSNCDRHLLDISL